MSEFIFENQGTNTYLVYTVLPTDTLDSMSLGMLTNNKIPGLAPVLFTQMDESKYIKYNVSSKVPVTQFFSGAVDKKRLFGVFRGIVNALLSAEDYMIDENTILLDKDYIFADVSSCETILVCLPIQGETVSHDMGAFFKDIMFSTQFNQTENCDYVARIMNFLNSTSIFSLCGFRELLDKIEESYKVKAATTHVPNKASVVSTPSKSVEKPTNYPKAMVPPQILQPTVTKDVKEKVVEKKMTKFGLLMHYSKENVELYKAQKTAKNLKAESVTNQKIKSNQVNRFAVPGEAVSSSGIVIPGQKATVPVASVVQQTKQNNNSIPVCEPLKEVHGQATSFGETTVLGGSPFGETGVLGVSPNAQAVTPYLIRSKNKEKILVNKPVFRIGKERDYVDYFISDNVAISRSHVNIISRNGEFFIEDTNSTNHTYVNEKMIQSMNETKIDHGTKIRLANENFEFKLY